MAPQYPGAQYSSQPGIMPGMRVQSPSAMMMNSSAGGGPMPSQHSAYRRPTPYSTHPQLLMQQQQQSQRKAQYQPPTANMSVSVLCFVARLKLASSQRSLDVYCLNQSTLHSN